MTLRALVFAAWLWLAQSATAPAAVAADRWQAPLAGSALRTFSLAADRFAPGQHRGIDLGAPLGTAVRAACGGGVSFAGSVPGGGRTVSVRCGRLIATYQQLGSIGVRRGALVLPGARLGTVGRSSDPRTRSSHVHLGARIAASGRYVDPLSLIGRAPPAAPTLPPAGRHARDRVPLGPAPAPQPASRPALQPIHHPLPHPTTSDRPQPLPWTIWIGLLCVGLAIPLGGVMTVRRLRRRRATAPLAQATT